jgi:glycerol-3-phosphate dehydrogenase
VVYDHGRHGGPRGLYSISGVKFTTARHVAEVTLRTMFGREPRPPLHAPERPQPLVDLSDQTLLGMATPLDDPPSQIEALMRRIVHEEAVLHAEDVLLRRLDSASILANWGKASEILRRALAPGRLGSDVTTFVRSHLPLASVNNHKR